MFHSKSERLLIKAVNNFIGINSTFNWCINELWSDTFIIKKRINRPEIFIFWLQYFNNCLSNCVASFFHCWTVLCRTFSVHDCDRFHLRLQYQTFLSLLFIPFLHVCPKFRFALPQFHWYGYQFYVTILQFHWFICYIVSIWHIIS